MESLKDFMADKKDNLAFYFENRVTEKREELWRLSKLYKEDYINKNKKEIGNLFSFPADFPKYWKYTEKIQTDIIQILRDFIGIV